jgi:hypothetical protein
MWYIVISILSVVLVAFFIWARADYKKQKRKIEKTKDKPHFRTEDSLEEYGKPMKDGESNPVDFEDAE